MSESSPNRSSSGDRSPESASIDLHQMLRDFSSHAKCVDRQADHSVWRLEFAGANSLLLHYPRRDGSRGVGRWRSHLRFSPAQRQFARLRSLQSSDLQAPRVLACLSGFTIEDQKGDAVLIPARDRLLTLRQLLVGDASSSGRSNLSDARERLAQIVRVLVAMGRLNMIPDPLDLEAFWIAERNGKRVVVPGATHRSGRGALSSRALLELGADALPVSRAVERARVWRLAYPQGPLPRRLPRGPLDRFARAARHAGEHPFRPLGVDGWHGLHLAELPMRVPWCGVSSIRLNAPSIESLRSLIDIARDIEDRTELEVFKRDPSGLVARLPSGLLEIGGGSSLILKRPLPKPGIRGFVQTLRLSRVRRGFVKTWRLLGRGIACELPLLLLERRVGIRLIDQMAVYAAVRGTVLSDFDLDALDDATRGRLLARCGAILRRIESFGFGHFDAKSSNWMIWTDCDQEPRPVLIDADGVRGYPYPGKGIARLARAMTHHRHYRQADRDWLFSGYRGR